MMENPEDRFEEQLREAARDYHRPPEPPREEMWAAIAAARRREQRRVIVIRPWLGWGLGIAALLAVGVGIGRWTARGRPTVEPPAAGAEAPSLAYQLATTQYLSRTEALLTGFRAQDRRGAVDAQVAASARDLLGTTRLMLDSPAARDPRLRALLEDLELLLAQIARLPSRGTADENEMNLITQGLEQRGVLPRLRTAIPAGPAVTRPQGAL